MINELSKLVSDTLQTTDTWLLYLHHSSDLTIQAFQCPDLWIAGKNICSDLIYYIFMLPFSPSEAIKVKCGETTVTVLIFTKRN